MASTIMVIDDDPQVCRLISIILSNEGTRVLVESDPIRGLEILKSEPVDVLFTDLRMPGCDGLEVIREARRVCPGVAVVLVTGHSSLTSSVSAFRLGAVDYLTKPFRPQDVRNALSRATNHRQAAAVTPAAELVPVTAECGSITVPMLRNLKKIEQAIVAEVVHREGGNKSAAARVLGLHRKTLYRILDDEKDDSPA